MAHDILNFDFNQNISPDEAKESNFAYALRCSRNYLSVDTENSSNDYSNSQGNLLLAKLDLVSVLLRKLLQFIHISPDTVNSMSQLIFINLILQSLNNYILFNSLEQEKRKSWSSSAQMSRNEPLDRWLEEFANQISCIIETEIGINSEQQAHPLSQYLEM